jgi:hypothetical protein
MRSLGPHNFKKSTYQDTYILGKGYMGTTGIEIPEKYLMIGTNHDSQGGEAGF